MLAIRQADKSDVDRVYDLIMAIADHHDQAEYVLTDKTKLESAGFGEDPKFGVFLAEDDGSSAGFLSYTVNYSIWAGGSYMNIDDVFVYTRYRGKGVGEALMHESKKVCKTMGIARVRWEVQTDNDGAIRFYERLGAEYGEKGIFRWYI